MNFNRPSQSSCLKILIGWSFLKDDQACWGGKVQTWQLVTKNGNLEPPSSLTLMSFSSSYFSSFSSSSTYSFTIIFSFSISPLLLFFLLTPQFHDLHEYWTTLHYNGTLDSHSLPLARGAKTHWNYQSINCSIENQSTILC